MNRRAEAADIDARLAALPRPALDASTGARIHARTREAFVTSTADRAAATAAGRWARLWSRALEPAAVTIAVVVYLIWTAQALAAIDWGRIALPSMNRIGSIGMQQPLSNRVAMALPTWACFAAECYRGSDSRPKLAGER